MKLNIVKHRKGWYIVSAVLMAVSLLALIGFGLKPGIDFTGGALLEVAIESKPSHGQLQETLAASGHKEAIVQVSNDSVLVRTVPLTEEQHQNILASFEKAFGKTTELKFDSIGPVIGNELRRTAFLAIFASLVLIGAYISWAFRGAGDFISSKKIALLTVIKTVHDVFISVGAYAILGYFFGYEMDTAFVAATLTILGYSINDGVVVLDRTRENLKKRISSHLSEVVDVSIEQTLARSINTSVTVFLALLAVFLFGGETTRPFAMLLLIGVAVGTYSSVFIASPALVTLEKWGKK
ncbi:protein-export membrane protein SecF [Candidatus Uhrbacteria bacterium RIFCSPHIGHO2_02_FULL_47_44]|uniref:Protein-export membrane protein SecF n=1 Tax=Candidatus Uhrbacteria bacterium RIFCSPLOWO2_02_FULL_48_18 TaxID=1802408 RepID=A0A1F7VBT5_9BACT|nr:MAG: protein-export membrane protein SecF [Candidatus Uhrbacteria bacterium RIFCSPHIGHO2_02_FULL_47_44]OGL76843.1 MAG: protein-export membrane protein SecF [Candidatus Uhrbacteria bacterium RIFCSPHIGHO2_12_FULL_47_12]OGL82312.1 MAG: protein-export membrane protein SecF [Candidatus Uhrbacteria bacterium RIFCSPLOWO2_01_FULL_47_17]OGL87959.1 MAG: protein-export membrane protein SecF [Candidatus Uhrbacteria bacterium RIFCSPLOWO2_02_FULL_48_18]OGL93579.1 MAG: protein-export membrane protein SecF 